MDIFNIPELLATYGYWGVFLVATLETALFFPLPGDTLLFTAGILVSGLGLNMYLLIGVLFLAGVIGSVMGYTIGVYIEHIHKYPLLKKFLKDEHIKLAHEFFEKYGFSTILLSKFVPIVRTFAPIVAGIARMDFYKFLLYTIVSSALWASSIPVVGYFFGKRFPFIVHYLSYIVAAVVLISFVPIAYEWWKKHLSHSRTK